MVQHSSSVCMCLSFSLFVSKTERRAPQFCIKYEPCSAITVYRGNVEDYVLNNWHKHLIHIVCMSLGGRHCIKNNLQM